MTSQELRQKYLDFFKDRGHKVIPPASLVPENDPTTLFTSSGMQPLIPYLLGESHPEGKRLVDSQPSFRSQDIEEVGDNRHTTFFEMLGNWSLGDYFKKEQLSWFWEFLTQELGLAKEKLYVSVFDPTSSDGLRGAGGNEFVPKDTESAEIWKSLGVPEEHIFYYGVKKNWWSRSGTPEQMPIGEIGGPDSEVFYDFGTVHDPKFGEVCHPNCDCGRFLEIGNSVFIQYKKNEDGKLEELPQKNVDFGGGLERLVLVTNYERGEIKKPEVFEIDTFIEIIKDVYSFANKWYENSSEEDKSSFRIIADHIKASTFLILDGVVPSNKVQGYVLRRLLRRSAVKMYQLTSSTGPIAHLPEVSRRVIDLYENVINRDREEAGELVTKVINEELDKFTHTLEKGLKEFEKRLSEMEKNPILAGKLGFDLYQTYGFPVELTKELLEEKGLVIDLEEFLKAFHHHQEVSRTASAGMFKGGLADHSEQVVKLHTATHLLHQSLRTILGSHVSQKGSNITAERLRFDFSHPQKMTDEEIKKVEELVNQKIKEDLPVSFTEMSKDDALNSGALAFFGEKYADRVKVYTMGDFSKEICGGPHVEHTGVLNSFKILKEESPGSGIRRIYASLSNR